MRRILVLSLAVLMIALMPAVASAQTVEEKADALAAFEAAVDGLGGDTAEEWTENAAALAGALDALEAAFGDEIDTSGLRAALDALNVAIEGGDLDEIAAAGEAVAAEAAAVAAAAAAAAGDGDDTTTTTVAAPTAVATGGPVDGGPNVALLGLAALLVLVAGGAFAFRLAADRR